MISKTSDQNEEMIRSHVLGRMPQKQIGRVFYVECLKNKQVARFSQNASTNEVASFEGNAQSMSIKTCNLGFCPWKQVKKIYKGVMFHFVEFIQVSLTWSHILHLVPRSRFLHRMPQPE